MSRLQATHPHDGELLLFADSEASPRHSKAIQAHLAACWQCRSALGELEHTIDQCVRYRRTVLQPCLPEPPAPWFDIHTQFARIDAEARPNRLSARVWEALRVWLTPRRLAPAAALAAILLLVVIQLRDTPSVRAAELLKKAVAAADAQPRSERWVQIRSGKRKASRAVGRTSRPAAPPDETRLLADLAPLFEAAGYDWEDPLSARAFAGWRDKLAARRDQVSTIEQPGSPARRFYEIQTQTDSSHLVEASLRLGADDLRPVQSNLRFRDREPVEITELESPPTVFPAPSAAVAEAFPARNPEAAATSRQPLPELAPATAGEELKVFALLRRLDADLGEPVEVGRESGQVTVTGVGVSPEIGQRIREELQAQPRVTVRFSDPQPGPLTPGGRTQERVSLGPEMARLQAEIEKHLGGRAAYERFAENILQSSESLMARVHALRRLAERFRPEVEAELSAEDRRLLWRLRHEHATAIAGLALRLEESNRPVLAAIGGEAEAPAPAAAGGGSWQEATEALFRLARRTESRLAAVYGGAAAPSPPDRLGAELLTSLTSLRLAAAEYLSNTVE